MYYFILICYFIIVVTAALQPLDVGNSVVGFSYDYPTLIYNFFTNNPAPTATYLHILPHIFSKSMAKSMIFAIFFFSLQWLFFLRL